VSANIFDKISSKQNLQIFSSLVKLFQGHQQVVRPPQRRYPILPKMAEVNKVFSEIAASNDHKTKNEKYKQLLDQFIEKNAKKELEAFVVHST
jgi:hypothetical protein